MLRLRLFGVPSLARDGELLSGRAVQRHRIALLALLAMSPDRRSSRDKLIALLWPESDAERGRNLLKVASYVLRSELGDDVLHSAGDELRLDVDRIAVDVAEFEAALARNEYAAAVALYDGPFMDGFFLSDAPQLEQWVSRERDRLAAEHRRGVETLADAAERARDFPAAVEWWKRRAVEDPYDSRIALRLMQTLEAAGNRAGALQHASIHERLLQSEFGVAPPAEITQLVDRLRRAPRVETLAERPLEAPPATPASATGPPQDQVVPAVPEMAAPLAHPIGRRTWLLAAAALLVVFSAAGAARAVWSRPDVHASIVVLPFVNLSADPDYEYFSDGLTEEVITRLAAIPELKVISRTSAMHYKGSTEPLPAIARALGVTHVLEGSVRQDAGRVRVSAQLIDAGADGHLWADNYEYELRDGLRVQEEIARDVAAALELKLGDRARRMLAKQGTNDPEAYELHQRGRFLWNTRAREAHELAIGYFERAIARDSGYADAYAALAHAHLTGYQLNLLPLPEADAYDRVKWAAERALALDDESSEAHLAFAIALQWQRNWPGAAREYRRAIELNPGNATARSWYSLLLRGMGRSSEALRESRQAAGLDPFGVVIRYNHGWQCYLERDWDCAIEQYGRALEVTAYPSAHRGLGLTYSRLGQHAEAIDALRRAVALAPHRSDFLADLAYVHAMAGRGDEARTILRQASAQPWEPYNIGRAWAGLGETDSALVWLERANWRWPHRAPRDDPAVDTIRSDPRFARLVDRVDRQMGIR